MKSDLLMATCRIIQNNGPSEDQQPEDHNAYERPEDCPYSHFCRPQAIILVQGSLPCCSSTRDRFLQWSGFAL